MNIKNTKQRRGQARVSQTLMCCSKGGVMYGWWSFSALLLAERSSAGHKAALCSTLLSGKGCARTLQAGIMSKDIAKQLQ
jgi:hypothetical protein